MYKHTCANELFSHCFVCVYTNKNISVYVYIVQSLSRVRLCNPMECSMPGFCVLHHLPKCAQTHIYWVSDAIQLSNPVLPPSPPALNLSQRQGLFQRVGIRLPKYWNFSFSISPSKGHSGLISFRTDWFDLLAIHTYKLICCLCNNTCTQNGMVTLEKKLAVSYKMKHKNLSNDTEIPLLGNIWCGTYVHTKTCTQVFTMTLFIITQNWKQPNTSFNWQMNEHIMSHSHNEILLGNKEKWTTDRFNNMMKFNALCWVKEARFKGVRIVVCCDSLENIVDFYDTLKRPNYRNRSVIRILEGCCP